jgi:Na+-translocating ferredoxin:NAD+ oxidoreductase RnfG subunit
MKVKLLLIFILFGCTLRDTDKGAERVVSSFFYDANEFKRTRVATDREFWNNVSALVKPKKISIREKNITIISALKSGQLLGYTVYTAEMGMHKPIFYAIHITSDLKIKGIEVLKYSESYGYEIKDADFLSQYTGKNISDKFTVSEDIDSITGATISVESTNRVAKKALAIIKTHFK